MDTFNTGVTEANNTTYSKILNYAKTQIYDKDKFFNRQKHKKVNKCNLMVLTNYNREFGVIRHRKVHRF